MRSPDNPARRRGGGLHPLAVSLPAATRAALGKHGLALGRLLSDWPAVVGPEFAARCLPERIAFPPGARAGGTLRLRVAPGWALMVQHVTPEMIERINTFFGYRAVTRLTLVQGPLPKAAPAKARRPERPLSPTETRALSAAVAPVTDPELRQALERLGAAIRRGEAG